MQNFFKTGGALAANSRSYITRECDDLLFKELKNGNFCYILTARQMGKSSLRTNVMARLSAEGAACFAIDVTQVGVKDVTAEQWYYTLVDAINDQLNVNANIAEWWRNEGDLTPVYRFFKFLKDILLTAITGDIYLFFDEIDSVLAIDQNVFSSDDFFAAIRSMYIYRADNPEFNRLTFAVIGVASPNDLMADRDRTPFNIGTSIPVNNFTLPEIGVFAEGLVHTGLDISSLLYAIHSWTKGQPVLTQLVAEGVSRNEKRYDSVNTLVDDLVNTLFLKRALSDSVNINLLTIQNRILSDDKYGMKMLLIYERILQGKSTPDNTSDPAYIYLKLTGLVRKVNNDIVINNRIYKEKFNQFWIDETKSKIDRPFNASLNEWLSNAKPEEKALKGEALLSYEEWMNMRDDLLPVEKEFYNFSIGIREKDKYSEQLARLNAERVAAEKQLVEAEREKIRADEKLTTNKIKANRQRVLIVAFSILLLVLVLTIGYKRLLEGKRELEITKISADFATKESMQSKAVADSAMKKALEKQLDADRAVIDARRSVGVIQEIAEHKIKLSRDELGRLKNENTSIQNLLASNFQKSDSVNQRLTYASDQLAKDITSSPNVLKYGDNLRKIIFDEYLKADDESRKRILPLYDELWQIIDGRWYDATKALYRFDTFCSRKNTNGINRNNLLRIEQACKDSFVGNFVFYQYIINGDFAVSDDQHAIRTDWRKDTISTFRVNLNTLKIDTTTFVKVNQGRKHYGTISTEVQWPYYAYLDFGVSARKRSNRKYNVEFHVVNVGNSVLKDAGSKFEFNYIPRLELLSFNKRWLLFEIRNYFYDSEDSHPHFVLLVDKDGKVVSHDVNNLWGRNAKRVSCFGYENGIVLYSDSLYKVVDLMRTEPITISEFRLDFTGDLKVLTDSQFCYSVYSYSRASYVSYLINNKGKILDSIPGSYLGYRSKEATIYCVNNNRVLSYPDGIKYGNFPMQNKKKFNDAYMYDNSDYGLRRFDYPQNIPKTYEGILSKYGKAYDSKGKPNYLIKTSDTAK